MNYPIPATSEEIIALGKSTIDEELIAAAIAGVIGIARSRGQSLEDLTAEVLKEDKLLDRNQRRWLRDLVIQAWKNLP